jgi:type IV pilus assembly protein PilX
MNCISPYTPPSARARGFVLVIALVFLTLLTLLGISALSNTSLQEKMAHNIKEKVLSQQVADGALLLAERWLVSLPPDQAAIQFTNRLDGPAPDGTDGLHTAHVETAPGPTQNKTVWAAFDWSSSSDVRVYPNVPFASGGTFSASLPLDTNVIAYSPRYIIERMQEIRCDGGISIEKPDCDVYRITSRATGAGGTGATISQVTVKKRK